MDPTNGALSDQTDAQVQSDTNLHNQNLVELFRNLGGPPVAKLATSPQPQPQPQIQLDGAVIDMPDQDDAENNKDDGTSDPGPQGDAHKWQSQTDNYQWTETRTPKVIDGETLSFETQKENRIPEESHDMMFSQGFERDGSRTPPLFTYHTYPPPEDIVYPAYPHNQPYRPVAERQHSYGDYLTQIPVTLPSTLPSMMHFQDAIKREGGSTNDAPLHPKTIIDPKLEAFSLDREHQGTLQTGSGPRYWQSNESDIRLFSHHSLASNSIYRTATRMSPDNATVYSADMTKREQDYRSFVAPNLSTHLELSDLLQPHDARTNDTLAPVPTATVSNASSLVCKECNKSVKTKSELREHQIRYHTPFKCSHPGCTWYLGFSTAYDLQRHINSKHIKRYRCPIPGCRSTWPRLDNLRTHIKRLHKEYWVFDQYREILIQQAEIIHMKTPFPSQSDIYDNKTILEGIQGPERIEKWLLSLGKVTRQNDVSAADATLPASLGHQQATIGHENFTPQEDAHPFPDAKVDSPLNKKNDVYSAHIEFEDVSHVPKIVMQEEIPFTDSGYASGPKPNYSPNIESLLEKSQYCSAPKLSTAGDDVNNEDTTTSYTATTSVGPSHTHYYITELCNDIYSKIGHYFDVKLWSNISKALPGLLKSLAIRIGYGSSAQENKEIMYFIHKRNKEIAVRLESLFCHEEDEKANGSGKNREGMSLLDKMNMWDRKSGEDYSINDIEDLYKGVKDYEDESINVVDLSLYHRTIFNSTAYEWFLANLRKESVLSLSEKQPRVMAEISQEILNKLPTGTMSKHGPVNIHEVEFLLQWEGTTRKQLEQKLYEGLIGSGRPSVSSTIVTGSPEAAQALTIRQYLDQTWPTTGLQLLDVLQKTVTNPDHRYNVMFPDETRLEAIITCSSLVIVTVGPAQFVAECGEQLAWLRAALSASQHSVGYCTPKITRYWVESVPSLSNGSKYKGHCDIGLDIAEPPVNPGDSKVRVQNDWQDLIGESIIIVGFPISRRPENYLGLEISYDILLYFLQACKTTTVDGLILIKGTKRALKLVKRSGDVFLWHLLPTSKSPPSCCVDHVVEDTVSLPYHPIDLKSLNTSRHIINRCIDLQTAATNDVDSNDLSDSLCRTKPSCNNVSTGNISTHKSGDLSPYRTGPEQNDNLSMLYESQNKNAITNLSAIRRDYDPFLKDENNLLSDGRSPLAVDSEYFLTTGSLDDSVDSDLISVSDASEQVVSLDSAESVYPHLKNLLDKLITGFQNTNQCQSSSRKNTSESTTQESSARPSSTKENSRKHDKRKRQNDNDDGDGDGFAEPPRKKADTSQGKSLQRSFACPFIKLDAIKHSHCCDRQLSRIRDVKQHISRRHTPERYCQRCLDTKFPDEQSLEQHLDLGTCPRNDPSMLDGISHHQQRQISRKSNSSLSEEDQWFAIWDILFPGHGRPISAHVEAGLSTHMRRLREYCSTHGPTALAEMIVSDPSLSEPEITAEQWRVYLERVIHQGINIIFERYINANLPSDSPRESRTLSLGQRGSSLELTQLGTSADSNADSGVVLDSEHSSRQTTSSMSLLCQFSNMTDSGYQEASTIRSHAEHQFLQSELFHFSGDDHFQSQLHDPSLFTLDDEPILNFAQPCRDFQAEDTLEKN
ncbi:hypothetical protein B7463_g2198, partial [Scytalidium lignicola]